MSKAEEKPVSEYGEPWLVVDDAGMWAVSTCYGDPVAIDFDEAEARRAVACTNALAGIPNPEAVREVLDAATNWAQTVSLLSTKRNVTEAQSRLYTAVSVMVSSAPSTGAQQK